MGNIKNLGDIFRIAVKIEKKLKDFYDVAEFAIQNPTSKLAIVAIKAKLTEKLAILEKVSPEKHGTLEWLKFAPPLEEDEIIPKNRITRASSPTDIFTQMMLSEESLKAYYAKVANLVTDRSQKELFESLVVFKTEQIEEIKRLMTIQGT